MQKPAIPFQMRVFFIPLPDKGFVDFLMLGEML
jgi:hypothetical protein